jgi:GH25 family lysozyme M1 (1,4-beta-N-acetylmuramidase)
MGRARDLGLVSGIDVSHHNGDIDFDKVRAAGNVFVFAKATQDNDFIDPMFVTNIVRARQAGLAAGGYHFFDYTLDGRDQADHFIDRLELAGAIDGALPPVVDVECWAPIGSSIHAVSATRLRDFVSRVYERTGRLPIIYTSVFMWRQVVVNAEGFEDMRLWAACWGCDAPPSIAPGWESWDFWQTGVGRVRGVGRLDANYYSGDAEDLTDLRLRPMSIASGAPATARHQVALDLGGRDATHLRTSPDGESWSGWSAIRGEPRGAIGREEGPHTLYVQLRTGAGLTSPVFSDSITLDRTGPEVSPPVIRLRQAPLGDDPVGVPVEVTWEALDPAAGLSDASVLVGCGPESRSETAAPGSAAPGRAASWTAALSLVPDADCHVSVIGRDGVGNETTVEAGAVAATVPVNDGDQPGTSVTGDQVGIVARRGPDLGRAAVYLDGEAIDLIDLYHPTPTGPEVVYIADLTPGVPTTITLEATGSSDPDATGTDVVIDAFVTLAAA